MTRPSLLALVLLASASASTGATVWLGASPTAHAEQDVPPPSAADPSDLPHEMPTGTSSVAATARVPEQPTEAADTRAPERHPFRVFPSARMAFGSGWIANDAHLVIDASIGIQAFQRPGLGIGALVGITRRGEGPETTALTLGVPVGFVSRNARIGFGVRPDLLLGRGAGEFLVGGRASAFVSYRQTLFVEGGYERLHFDGAGIDGYRVVAGVDLGIVFAGLATFGGAFF